MTRLLIFCSVLLAALPMAVDPAGAARRRLVDRAYIIVNDKVVTKREVDITRELQESEYRRRYKGEELEARLKEMDAMIIDEIIESLLMESHAERLGILVSDKEIESRINTIVQRDPRITSAYSDRALKEFVVKDLLRKRVIQREITSRIYVDDRTVRQACLADAEGGREVDIGHILLRGQSEGVLKRIAAIREELESGADFEELALSRSEDPRVKSNKGRLGFIAKGQFVKPFEEAAFALQVGELSQPVKSKFGYHLIKLFGERRKVKVDCEKMNEITRRRYHDRIWNKQRLTRMNKFLEGLRKKADIVVLDEK